LEDAGVDEDIIKMSLKETGCEGVDWIKVAQDRVKPWIHGNETLGSIKWRTDFLISRATFIF
jgi:hypothetical protein